MYDIYTLLNDILLEGGRFIVLAVVMVLGVFCGKKIRDRKETKKFSDESDGK